jgi:hypothetical protein
MFLSTISRSQPIERGRQLLRYPMKRKHILAAHRQEHNRSNQDLKALLARQEQDSQLLLAPLRWCSQGISQLTVVDTHCPQKGLASSDLSLLELAFHQEKLARFKSEGPRHNQEQRFV